MIFRPVVCIYVYVRYMCSRTITHNHTRFERPAANPPAEFRKVSLSLSLSPGAVDRYPPVASGRLAPEKQSPSRLFVVPIEGFRGPRIGQFGAPFLFAVPSTFTIVEREVSRRRCCCDAVTPTLVLVESSREGRQRVVSRGFHARTARSLRSRQPFGGRHFISVRYIFT